MDICADSTTIGFDQSPIDEPNGTRFLSSFGLTLPALLPEELADTFLDVVVLANGHTNRRDFIASLSCVSHDLSRKSVIEVIAELCMMSVGELARLHTLTPFTRAFVLHKEAQYRHGADVSGHRRHSAMRLPRRSLCFCEKCVHEDRGFHGRSYWRRSHQVPGIEWCEKHGVPLLSCDRESLQLEPHCYLDRASRVTSTTLPETGVIPRYFGLIGFLSTMSEPISVHVLQRVVRSALKKAGLRNSEKGKRPLLSDFASEACPLDWLHRLLPTIKDKRPKQHFRSIDNAGRGASPSQSGGILALALLFEDIDECASKLLAFHADKQTRTLTPKAHEGLPPGFWRSDGPLKLYLRHKGDERLIAQELGLNLAYVHRSLRAAGLPPGVIIRRPPIKQALREFLNGNSIEIVTKRNGLQSKTIEGLLHYNMHAIKPLLY